jgi:hypothetical protein
MQWGNDAGMENNEAARLSDAVKPLAIAYRSQVSGFWSGLLT